MDVLTPGIVAALRDAIKESIGKPRYELWFSGNTNLTLDDDTLTIGVPNRFYREWLENHFQHEINQAVRTVLQRTVTIQFKIDSALFQQSRQQTAAPPTPVKPAPSVKRVKKPTRYALERFVVGAPNRVAHAAVSSVIENPRNGYSPLFLYGGNGVGKTHLLRGLESELRLRFRNLNILVVSCEEFTNQFVEAMKASKLSAFRRKMRQLDLLVVDDVQFLANKRATQEEFLHTFKSLDERGGKLLFASDCHPRRMTKLPEELKTRFMAGMVAKLDPPSREMRRAILRDKAAQRQLMLPNDVVDYLAERLHSNVCELEGAINYLQHYSETLNTPVDLATTQKALLEILRHSAPVMRVSDVRKKACEIFSINSRMLKQRSRARAVSHPRMFLHYLARNYTQATYSEIGSQVGGLNHSTVIASEKKIRALIRSDGEIVLGDRLWKVRDALECFEREVGHA